MLKLRERFDNLYFTPHFWYGILVLVISYIIMSLLPTEAVMDTQVTADFYGVYLGLGLCALVSLLLIGHGIQSIHRE